MTELEISKALALAIGWKPKDIRCTITTVFVMTEYPGYFPQEEIFNYDNWSVIGPIAERYDAFPYERNNRSWMTYSSKFHIYGPEAETPQKAIALAVIRGLSK